MIFENDFLNDEKILNDFDLFKNYLHKMYNLRLNEYYRIDDILSSD